MFLGIFIAGSSTTDLLVMFTVLSTLAYVCYVRYNRYKSLNKMIKKYPDPNVILQDHDIAVEIYSNIFRKEFPCKLSFLERKEIEKLTQTNF